MNTEQEVAAAVARIESAIVAGCHGAGSDFGQAKVAVADLRLVLTALERSSSGVPSGAR